MIGGRHRCPFTPKLLRTWSLMLVSPAGIEPATHSLEGCCSIRLSYGERESSFGRGDRIRTYDPLLPKQVRYQTALHPDDKRAPQQA